jgi:hypothetical protein
MKKNATMMSKRGLKTKNKRSTMNINRKKGGRSGAYAYY